MHISLLALFRIFLSSLFLMETEFTKIVISVGLAIIQIEQRTVIANYNSGYFVAESLQGQRIDYKRRRLCR